MRTMTLKTISLSKALIDGDPIVYRIGFACQTTDKETGLVTADPESHTLHSCKQFVNQLLKDIGAPKYKIYLTGKGNYRHTIREDYKANRKGRGKPVHYNLIREYLVKRFNAQVIDSMEADDALGLAQTPSTVIATIDKDLLMVEGMHYNYGKKEWAEVTADEGTYFFYKQMLTGDRVDNIIGIRGIGEKKAAKLLNATKQDKWDELVIDMYMQEFDDGFHRAVENSQLLWILQRGKSMPIRFVNE
jgi:5'-3' exonuclease